MVQIAVRRLIASNSTISIPSRDLEYRTLLHLPRFSPAELTLVAVSEEASRLARRATGECGDLASRIPSASLTGDALEVGEVDDNSVQIINRCLHYIGTPRSAFVGLGLYRPGPRLGDELPLTLVALSEFDLGNVTEMCTSLNPDSTVLVSRVYSFPASRANSISALLGHARRWLKTNRPDVRWMITYLNTNLGFTGVSYRADNWKLVGREEFDALYSADGDYLTSRVMRAEGASGELSVRSRPMPSQWRLQPLHVLVRGVCGDAWNAPPVVLRPWS
jgi:hypothetical protein